MAKYHLELGDMRITAIRPIFDGTAAVRVDGIRPGEVTEIIPEIDLSARLSKEQIVPSIGRTGIDSVMVNHQIYGQDTLFFRTHNQPDADQEVFDFLRSSLSNGTEQT